MKEIWDAYPHWKTNFECILTNTGRWGPESAKLGYNLHGKWLLLIEPKTTNNCPTFADMRNFATGLFEVEFRNDNFVMPNGTSRPSQMNNKIEMFKDIFEEIGNRERSKIKQGIDFYLNNGK
jgi:hypothetical protein